jgi:hypothetical protein
VRGVFFLKGGGRRRRVLGCNVREDEKEGKGGKGGRFSKGNKHSNYIALTWRK